MQTFEYKFKKISDKKNNVSTSESNKSAVISD